MDDILKNIANQREDIKRRIDALVSEVHELQEDYRRLEKAEAAIKGQSYTAFRGVKPISAKPVKTLPVTHENPKLTIKEMVLLILSEKPDGLVALEILREINSRFNQSYVRTSLSPQLSRLKQSGAIFKDGKRWALIKYKRAEMPM